MMCSLRCFSTLAPLPTWLFVSTTGPAQHLPTRHSLKRCPSPSPAYLALLTCGLPYAVLRFHCTLPNHFFTTLIKGLGQADLLFHAKQVFFSMPLFSCCPNHYLYKALLDAILGYSVHPFLHDLQGSTSLLKCVLLPLLLCSCKECRYPATFVCTMKDCSNLGAKMKGEEIHAKMNRQGWLGRHIVQGNALVDMYAKCDALAKAHDMFDELPPFDVISWTALIAGYAQLGKIQKVFDSFSKMIGESIDPNVITFVIMLTACSHAGLVEERQKYFDTMSTVYCIAPTLEHHTCMVDLFSRTGHLDLAISMIEKMPHSDCLLLWSAQLGACRKWSNVELGRWAFTYAVLLDEKCAAADVGMSNIYSANVMQKKAEKVEALRLTNGAWKIPASCWWIDVKRNIPW